METLPKKNHYLHKWTEFGRHMMRQCTSGRVRTVVALFVYPIITFYLFDAYTHNPFTSMNFKTQVLNILFYQLAGVLMFALFRWLKVAMMALSSLFMVLGLANYYVLSFRSAPIMPWDIFSLGTAASVADNFDYSLKPGTLAVLGGFILLLILESRCKMKMASGRGKIRLAMGLLAAFCLWQYTNMVQNDMFVAHFGLYDKLFTPTVMNKRDGNVVAFLMEMEYMNVDKPSGYDAEEVEQYLSSRQPAAETGSSTVSSSVVGGEAGDAGDPATDGMFSEAGQQLPNIIVIMDEAFSDLAVLGEFETNKDYMPFLHSMQQGAEDTMTGTLHVSVLGGNTANTEFEFLTGNTMAFLPQGSVPYQQYVNGEVFSVASYLRELGYQTVAMHPYYADGWERDEVYPRLGFERFLSIEDFKGEEKVRKYYSDDACFEKIAEIFEEKDDRPLFLFNVTMQNHSGYTEKFSNFYPDIKVTGSISESLNAYLSLIKLSDNSLANLIHYFSGIDEDTMIVFFGDHQPTAYVSSPIVNQNGKTVQEMTEEEQEKYYQVPFLIWANFDIEECTGLETSANYLAGIALSQCRIPLPAYQQGLEELRQKYPVISAIQVLDAEGNQYQPDDLDEELNRYRQIQYYSLFE